MQSTGRLWRAMYEVIPAKKSKSGLRELGSKKLSLPEITFNFEYVF